MELSSEWLNCSPGTGDQTITVLNDGAHTASHLLGDFQRKSHGQWCRPSPRSLALWHRGTQAPLAQGTLAVSHLES